MKQHIFRSIYDDFEKRHGQEFYEVVVTIKAGFAFEGEWSWRAGSEIITVGETYIEIDQIAAISPKR